MSAPACRWCAAGAPFKSPAGPHSYHVVGSAASGYTYEPCGMDDVEDIALAAGGVHIGHEAPYAPGSDPLEDARRRR